MNLVFIDPIPFSNKVGPVHVGFHRAQPDDWPDVVPSQSRKRRRRLAKNLFELGAAFAVGPWLVLARSVVDRLACFATFDESSAVITEAFYYPFLIGSEIYKEDTAFDPTDEYAVQTVRRFAKKYRCDSPVTVLFAEIIPERIDAKSATHRHSLNHPSCGIRNELALFSVHQLAEKGVSWSQGYIFVRDAFDQISPYLNASYFVIEEWTV